MSLPLQGLSSALCALEPRHVSWARAAARLLGAQGFDVSIAPVASDAGYWYRGDHLAFDPLRQRPLKGAPAKELIRILSTHEDVLAEIEQALGLAAEFAHHTHLPDDWPVLVLSREGQLIGRLAVLCEIAGPPVLQPPIIMPLAFIAARLPLAEAERLSDGDMLVLAHGPWRLARQEGEGGDAPPGSAPLGFDPVSGRLAPLLADPVPSASGASFAMSADEQSSGLSVPVAIHLSDSVVTQAELARMTETGSFDLGAISEGLRATLSVGGRSIGRGEIVRLGDRFAVLLDGSEAASTQPGEAQAAQPDGTAGTGQGEGV